MASSWLPRAGIDRRHEPDVPLPEEFYEPYYLQDLLPWERRWEEQNAFDPEGEAA